MNARAGVEARPTWTFLTNHGHVLIAVAADRDTRVRDIAERVGITERAVQGILDDLERGGYLERERLGRRNRYTLRAGGRFRHPAEQGHAIDELLRLFG